MSKNEEYILTSKRSDGKYSPDRLVIDPNTDLDDLEYGDVAKGEYQLWGYPSGNIYQITPDREVPDDDQFATPNNTRGEVWRPTLNQVGQDGDKVAKAYKDIAQL